MAVQVHAPRRPAKAGLLPNYLALLALTFFALAPIVILGFNSLKSNAEVGRNPLGPPQAVQWENFPRAWEQGDFATTTRNSALLVVGTVLAVLVLGGLAAYSLARLRLPGSNALMLLLLVISTVPLQLFLVPLFFLWKNFGLLNTHLGLILIYTATNAPFAIFLLRSYMMQLPADFEDAARVDGADELGVFWKVVLPLSWPGFLTVGLVVALGVWNEFFLATVFISDPDLFPVATSYYKFTSRFSRDWSLTSAAAVMMVAPVLLLFLALQRRFIDGLTQGGLKG
jgi:raffinose/stachyose/melibiose transport system permease protein